MFRLRQISRWKSPFCEWNIALLLFLLLPVQFCFRLILFLLLFCSLTNDTLINISYSFCFRFVSYFFQESERMSDQTFHMCEFVCVWAWKEFKINCATTESRKKKKNKIRRSSNTQTNTRTPNLLNKIRSTNQSSEWSTTNAIFNRFFICASSQEFSRMQFEISCIFGGKNQQI